MIGHGELRRLGIEAGRFLVDSIPGASCSAFMGDGTGELTVALSKFATVRKSMLRFRGWVCIREAVWSPASPETITLRLVAVEAVEVSA